MAQSEQRLFHQRYCREAECGEVFWICRPCDRGQRYCSERCRLKARRRQRREANRRHQQSPEGRLDHRDRQRAYRLRRVRDCVTDLSRSDVFPSVSIPGPESLPRAMVAATRNRPEEDLHGNTAVTACYRRSRSATVRCLICGREGDFIDPFRRGG